jgi:hypothetical protein
MITTKIEANNHTQLYLHVYLTEVYTKYAYFLPLNVFFTIQTRRFH